MLRKKEKNINLRDTEEYAGCAVVDGSGGQHNVKNEATPSLQLGPTRWCLRITQLSAAAGSVSAGMELSVSSYL